MQPAARPTGPPAARPPATGPRASPTPENGIEISVQRRRPIPTPEIDEFQRRGYEFQRRGFDSNAGVLVPTPISTPEFLGIGTLWPWGLFGSILGAYRGYSVMSRGPSFCPLVGLFFVALSPPVGWTVLCRTFAHKC